MKRFNLVVGAAISLATLPVLAGNLKGTVKLDGSSTVFPVAEAVAEEFQKVEPRVRVTVGLSGSGGGFKKFTSGEIDISNASRPIKGKEVALAQKNGIKYLEIPVAYDGISVILSKKNDFLKTLSYAELKKIWQPNSPIKTWKDLNPAYPDQKIKLYGPGADSGTFDFFTETVMGESRVSRSDYVSSEDDNVLVRGIAADKYSLGYLGYAYYLANKSSLKLAAIAKTGNEYVAPTPESIESGKYPLSRPLLLYINVETARKPEVKKFVEFFIENAATLSSEVGYVPLPKQRYVDALATFRKAVTESKSH